MAEDTVLEQKEKLGGNQKIGALAAAIVAATATGYVPNYINLYYTELMGVAIGTIGAIIMITKLLDGVSDIIMGMIIDRTHTKWGKAKPWLLAGAAGLSLSMMLLFSCPANFGMGGKIAFATLFYILANPIFGTMCAVAANTLPNLISGNSDHRATIGVFKSMGALIPIIVIGIVVPNLLSSLGENQTAYTIITLVFVVLALLSALIAFLLIRETVTERAEAVLGQAKEPVIESLKHLFTNKYFLWLAGGTILYNLTAVPVATYYAKYIFHDVGKAAFINIPSILMILLLPLALPLIKKFGKRQVMVAGLACAALGHIIIFFANDNLGLFMVGKTIAAVLSVPYFVALIPLMGEVCDYALYKSGKPMDGTISSANSMGEKIGVGLTAGVSSLMMQLAHFQSNTTGAEIAQPDSALFMIRFLMSIFPALLYLLAAFCFWHVDMDKENIGEIQKELKEKGMR
ncbi:MAG: MFS transporter [Clostridia bacterium]|nr:MFS transporter [Clostridia bacterium]